MALHRIAIIQICRAGEGRSFYERRIAAGDSRQRALRALKRRISRVVYARLKADAPPVDSAASSAVLQPV